MIYVHYIPCVHLCILHLHLVGMTIRLGEEGGGGVNTLLDTRQCRFLLKVHFSPVVK